MLPVHARNLHSKHTRKKDGLIQKTQTLSGLSWRTADVCGDDRCHTPGRAALFPFLHPAPILSDKGGNGAVLGHDYLGTFILITEALSNCCLVTNAFEIDLLTYYEML